MATNKARVAVNGYGVIGKRVADAVALQDDMESVGVANVVSNYRIKVAVERGYPIYASVPEKHAEMEAAGMFVSGTLDDLLHEKVLPDLDITTMAGAGPYNLSHLHYVMIETTQPLNVDQVRDALHDTAHRVCAR